MQLRWAAPLTFLLAVLLAACASPVAFSPTPSNSATQDSSPATPDLEAIPCPTSGADAWLFTTATSLPQASGWNCTVLSTADPSVGSSTSLFPDQQPGVGSVIYYGPNGAAIVFYMPDPNAGPPPLASPASVEELGTAIQAEVLTLNDTMTMAGPATLGGMPAVTASGTAADGSAFILILSSNKGQYVSAYLLVPNAADLTADQEVITALAASFSFEH